MNSLPKVGIVCVATLLIGCSSRLPPYVRTDVAPPSRDFRSMFDIATTAVQAVAHGDSAAMSRVFVPDTSLTITGTREDWLRAAAVWDRAVLFAWDYEEGDSTAAGMLVRMQPGVFRLTCYSQEAEPANFSFDFKRDRGQWRVRSMYHAALYPC